MTARHARMVLVAAVVAAVQGACSLAVSTDGLAGDSLVGSPAETSLPEASTSDAADAADTADTADARVLPAGTRTWTGNGHGYLLVLEPKGLAWDEARDRAIAAGGHLVSIASAGENDFVIALAKDQESVAFNDQGVGPWLGGYQPTQGGAFEPAGGWQWVDGTPWAFTGWGGQPDDTGGFEGYLDLYHEGGEITWNDEAIGGTIKPLVSYVVEFD